jgi:recombination protein RecA
VVKNKLAPPFREAHFEILYGMGVHRVAELIDSAETMGVLEKNGTWYSHKGVKLAQGREKTMAYMDENPKAASDLRAELFARTRAQLPGAPRPAAPAAAEDSAAA